MAIWQFIWGFMTGLGFIALLALVLVAWCNWRARKAGDNDIYYGC